MVKSEAQNQDGHSQRGLEASDLNIETGTKDLRVDIDTMPLIVIAPGCVVNVMEATPTAIVEGQVLMTGAAQQFPADACKSITIENDSDRSLGNAVVYIGHDNLVSAVNGYALRPGCTKSFDIDNANRIWCIGTVNNVITYGGVN